MRIVMSTLSGVGYGGVTYYRHMLPSLAKVDRNNEYIIYAREYFIRECKIDQSNFKFVLCSEVMKYSVIRFLWEQLVLPFKLRKDKADVVFTAKNMNVFLAGVKTIIAIRNMEPMYYWRYKNHWKLNIMSALRRLMTELSLRTATAVIAVSEATKNYFVKNYTYAKRKMYVVYNGKPTLLGPADSCQCTDKRCDFILTSSKFVAYANQLKLLKGYSVLCQEMENVPQLWMAGGVHDESYYREVRDLIREKGLEERVRILGLVSHAELSLLYSRARCFVFPSTLEACPQTLIEAMSKALPVATSDVGPMPEICQDGAIYFNPYDERDIADKLRVLISDPTVVGRLKKTSVKRSRDFSWEKCAKQTIQVFEQVMMA